MRVGAVAAPTSTAGSSLAESDFREDLEAGLWIEIGVITSGAGLLVEGGHHRGAICDGARGVNSEPQMDADIHRYLGMVAYC